ncbi:MULTISPECIES: hypothetical protein [unclassified Streptomyces]|uniref:hypothetical protein n=1 Tax=unclassified Streptomyces TaxID=2593676 RepID=UPI0013DE6284|nr:MULTISPECIES: hypothetical protein [unclassified Streptomyces]
MSFPTPANRDHEHVLAAEDVVYAADQLLASDPSDSERATAELVNYVAAAWDT